MIARITTALFSLLAALVWVSCASTPDLARDESSTCEVHRCAMTVQLVDCAAGGFSGYRTEYDTTRRTKFPHHGRSRFSEDHGYMYARHLRTHVCADCTKAHDQWRAEHPNQ